MADEFRLAQPHELGAVFDLRARAFGRFTPSEWAAFVEQDPWQDAGADLVAISEGRIVATLRILARQIAGVGGELRLAGFGAVACDPAVRGRGYIRHLLGLAHDRNRAAGYDLALLFTNVPWVYSGSAGFTPLPLSRLDVDVRRLPPPRGEWTVAAADPVRHLAGMRRVYEQFGQDRPGYPLRGDPYWKHSARLSDPNRTRVALNAAGQVAAYLRARLSADEPARVLECPYAEPDAVYALAAELAEDPALPPGATLSGRLPRDHALGCAGEWSIADGAMAHPYTAAGVQLLEMIRDPLNMHTVYWSADGF